MKKNVNRNKIKTSNGEKAFQVINNIFMFVLSLVMLYPVWHVLMASFSESSAIIGYGGVLLKPLGFSTNAYNLMMKNPMIVKGYLNTIFIVVAGTVLNLIFTSIAAYVLSRKDVYWQKYLMLFVVFTMYFSGGMIPTYLVFTKLYMLRDSYFALILPTLINTFNLVILKTAFASIPTSLEESAKLDGAGHWRILTTIILPLSKASLAVMVLYYAVEHWNSWFTASIYLNTRTKFPLQMILREILISNDTTSMSAGSGDLSDQQAIGETIKYAVIVAATIPILCVYPFLQKYFVKGVMVGAVKG